VCIATYIAMKLTFAQVMREVGWVVFDEIHYMRDPGECTVMGFR